MFEAKQGFGFWRVVNTGNGETVREIRGRGSKALAVQAAKEMNVQAGEIDDMIEHRRRRVAGRLRRSR